MKKVAKENVTARLNCQVANYIIPSNNVQGNGLKSKRSN